LTTHINPAAVSELAEYITVITKQNEHLRVRAQELLEANNREVERRRAAERQVQFLTNRLLGVEEPEETNGNTRKEEAGSS
jgi:hypothetical protein